MIPSQFSRTALLIGRDGFKQLKDSNVIIFGVGGVGSWVAEALVRTGIGNITIVDPDNVATSNINRQLPALHSTVGQSKVEVLRHRLLDINPDAKITAIKDIYTSQTASNYNLDGYDAVVDAIDSVADKALLILNATACRHTRLFSSMGAALKLDPTRIRTAEFWKVAGCPLAAALRRRFKRDKTLPKRKFLCIYSDELLKNHPEALTTIPAEANDNPMTFGKLATNGSLCHITTIFGMTLAGLVISHLLKATPRTSVSD